jgi:ABC-2 type transport system permease protein
MERVRKKSFIIATFITPLLMVGLMVAPTLVMLYGSSDQKQVVVVDRSGMVRDRLVSTSEVEFVDRSDLSKREACMQYGEDSGVFGVLYVGSEIEQRDSVQLITNESSSLMIEESITQQLNAIVEREKLRAHDIENLEEILASVATDIELATYENDGTGEEASMESTSSGISYFLGLLLGMMLYMLLILYGQMVLTSVVEEKASHVIDVMVTSTTPFQIMMGKIIGVASVALTQFLIWIVFTMLIVTVAGQALGLNEAAQTMSSVSSEVPVAEITSAMQDDGDGLLQALKDVNYVQIIGCFIIYFVLGYLLYSSMFAAVGAAVDNEADTQQLILPITMPLIVGLFLMLHTFQYPDSALSFWGSVIPFTSPMVMMARIAYGVPMWELALSIGVLVLTFVGMAYLSGRIYRVGILMYGKKPGWKEIWKWLKY